MKRIFTICAAILLTASVILPKLASAQSPEKMSYQAIIRNSSDQLVTSQQVGMQISILQGSADGTVVYAETQTPTTNANGLVSIEIGGENATVVSGAFSAIDWANGIFFIKTETDPSAAGATSYTITGTSQLLSVPYALHSKTAESVTGTLNETDPIYTGSEAANITATDINKLSNLSGTNTGDQNISGIAINKQAIQDTASQIRADIPDVGGFLSSYTETDPTFTNSQAANITASDIANLDNLSGVNTGDQDGSETKVTAGINVTITGTGTTANPYVVGLVPGTAAGQMLYWNGTAWIVIEPGLNEQLLQYKNGVPTWSDGNINCLLIGDGYQGGIIAYFLVPGDPGYNASVRHGLIAAPNNHSTELAWGCRGTGISGADGTALGTGNQNTIDIEAGCGTAGTAADICANLSLGGYADWYLPSKDELNKLYINRTIIGGLGTEVYWSSTEWDNNYAWAHNFNNDDQYGIGKEVRTWVRAIRAF